MFTVWFREDSNDSELLIYAAQRPNHWMIYISTAYLLYVHKMRSWSTQISESGKCRRISTVFSPISHDWTTPHPAPRTIDSGHSLFLNLLFLDIPGDVVPSRRGSPDIARGFWMTWMKPLVRIEHWNSDEADLCLRLAKKQWQQRES
jgi:hypothetical protein